MAVVVAAGLLAALLDGFTDPVRAVRILRTHLGGGIDDAPIHRLRAALRSQPMLKIGRSCLVNMNFLRKVNRTLRLPP